ncbi:MAG TPA: ABC transporter substrate-binding protein [Methylomirabilota bacterium]|nr:ABC transporter substrate-binding protein [Methylomirabilota bacterium]
MDSSCSMPRRTFMAMMAGGLLTAPLAAEAQQARVPKIGVLLLFLFGTPGQPSPLLDALRGGLRDLGYVEGQNLVIEYRWAEGQAQRLAELATDLVRLNVAVIVTGGTPATLAAKAATTAIPVVMTNVGDPVGSNIVASLARPDANVTGLSLLETDLDGKRIELLKEAVPHLTRLAILWSANDPGMTLAFGRVGMAAQALGLALQNLAVREPADFPRAFDAAVAGRAEALFVTAQPFTNRHRAEILALVAKQRLPAMYTLRGFVDAGGLMAYGPSQTDQYRRAATYVDRILKGAKPADLPVEQPTTFDLVINLKTAKALGLTMPPSLLQRADQVIE